MSKSCFLNSKRPASFLTLYLHLPSVIIAFVISTLFFQITTELFSSSVYRAGELLENIYHNILKVFICTRIIK